MKYLLYLYSCFLIISCDSFTPKEEIFQPEYTPELCVFGLLSSDSSQEFVVIERTLRLSEKMNGMQKEFIVDDAVVKVFNQTDTTDFTFVKGINPYSTHYYYEHDYSVDDMYIDLNQDFSAVPGQTYKLEIKTPDGHKISAQTTMPDIPQILSPSNMSRIERANLMELQVKWQESSSSIAYIVSFMVKYKSSYPGSYDQPKWMNIYEDDYELYYDSPADLKNIDFNTLNELEDVISDTVMIKVEALDRMLYDYALKNEMASLTGSDFNLIEGGIGVFGSVSVDSVKVILQ